MCKVISAIRGKKALHIDAKQIRKFRDYLYDNEKSAATIRKYTGSIGKLKEYLSGCEITKERLLEYREWMQGQYSPQTVNAELAAINAWLKFCKMESLFMANRPGSYDFRNPGLHFSEQLHLITFCRFLTCQTVDS